MKETSYGTRYDRCSLGKARRHENYQWASAELLKDSRARRDNAMQVLIVMRGSTRLHVETNLGSEIG